MIINNLQTIQVNFITLRVLFILNREPDQPSGCSLLCCYTAELEVKRMKERTNKQTNKLYGNQSKWRKLY